MPKVVNLRKEAYDIYIGRGSIWGNPYSHIPTGTKARFIVATRDEAIARYEGYARNNALIMANLYSLKNKVLGCFCKPKSCHGDTLVKLYKEKFGDDDLG